jgi:hypothetical protein
MSRYEELGRAIEHKDVERGMDTDQARNFAMRLIEQFEKHLGAPDDAVHVLPAEDVLKGGHTTHTLGEALERNGDGFTMGVEIDFPHYVTGIRLNLAPNGGSSWKVNVDGSTVTEVLAPLGEWGRFVTEVAEHLQHAVAAHAPPEHVAFRSR